MAIDMCWCKSKNRLKLAHKSRFIKGIKNMQKVCEVQPSLYRVKGNRDKSEIESIPDEIDSLIDNKMYRNKFKKLIREGHLRDLIELAEIAQSKDKPSFWFAKVCAKARWENTLTWLKKARDVARKAIEIAKRLSAGPEQMKIIYKACWRRKDVLRHAITASETGIDRIKYFNWLVWRT